MTVVDDFAHHPTAIRATIEGARSRWPGQRLWVAFEPRSNTMRRRIFEEELSAGAGGRGRRRAGQREPGRPACGCGAAVSGAGGGEAARGRGGRRRRLASADAIADYLGGELSAGDVVLVLSNGSFDGLCDKLLARLSARSARAARGPVMRRMRSMTRRVRPGCWTLVERAGNSLSGAGGGRDSGAGDHPLRDFAGASCAASVPRDA